VKKKEVREEMIEETTNKIKEEEIVKAISSPLQMVEVSNTLFRNTKNALRAWVGKKGKANIILSKFRRFYSLNIFLGNVYALCWNNGLLFSDGIEAEVLIEPPVCNIMILKKRTKIFEVQNYHYSSLEEIINRCLVLMSIKKDTTIDYSFIDGERFVNISNVFKALEEIIRG